MCWHGSAQCSIAGQCLHAGLREVHTKEYGRRDKRCSSVVLERNLRQGPHGVGLIFFLGRIARRFRALYLPPAVPLRVFTDEQRVVLVLRHKRISWPAAELVRTDSAVTSSDRERCHFGTASVQRLQRLQMQRLHDAGRLNSVTGTQKCTKSWATTCTG